MDKTEYKIIDNFKDLRRLVKACKETGYACVDFETTGTELFKESFYPTILSVSFQPGSSIIIPLGHPDSPLKDNWLKYLKFFGEKVISNPDIVKLGWNWKFETKIFQKYGIFYRGTVIDGMLAKYILNEERPMDLKSMVERYIPEYGGYQKRDDFDKFTWDNKPFLPLCEYAAIDTDMTFRLSIFFESKIIEQPKLYTLFRNLVMPASRVLSATEYRGLPFDRQMNLDLHVKYEKLIEDKYKELLNLRVVKRFNTSSKKDRINQYIEGIEQEIEELQEVGGKDRMIKTRETKIVNVLAGKYTSNKEKALVEDINFGSPKQLIELLFTHEKGFKFDIIEKTEKGAPSTAEATLEALKEYDKTGFMKNLLEYRGLKHAYASFIKGYKDLIQEDEKVHGSFNIHMTVTGRLSSSKPNLQQIPKKEVNPDIKPQFVTPPGQLFLSFDYSQAELRVLAYMAKDKNMIQWFKEGKDIHLASATQKYGVTYEEAMAIYEDEMHPEYPIWKVRRKDAKITNFGAVYGVTAQKLAKQLSTKEREVTDNEAQEFLDNFFQVFSGIQRFMKKQTRLMEKNGYVESLFGRKRRCPGIFSDEHGKYLEATRQSYNAPVQSSASDTALFATVLLHWMVKQGKLPPINEVSTVHDSVYNFTFPDYINPWTIYQLNKIFSNPQTKKYFGFEIKAPELILDYSVGRNMLEEFPYIPGYDYNRMLLPNFTKEAYFEEHKKTREISVTDYPKYFPEYFTKQYIKKLRNRWIRKINSQPLMV